MIALKFILFNLVVCLIRVSSCPGVVEKLNLSVTLKQGVLALTAPLGRAVR